MLHLAAARKSPFAPGLFDGQVALVTGGGTGIGRADEEGQDDKIIAVAVDDPEFQGVNDIKELPTHRLREIQQFLRDYKSLEGKVARVGPLEGAKKAHRVIKDAVELYRDEIYPTLGVPASKRP